MTTNADEYDVNSQEYCIECGDALDPLMEADSYICRRCRSEREDDDAWESMIYEH